MIPYLFTFALSAGLFELGSACEGLRNGRRLSLLLCALAVIPLCVLAGARDVTVGTDTAGYGVFVYQQGILSSSFEGFTQALDNSSWDIAPLFALGSFIVIKLFESQFAFFFAIELAMLIPVVIAARNASNKHLGLIMLAYMLVFFIPGLNMMRQSIAMGFVVLAVLSMIRSRYIRAVVLSVVAILLHASAVVVIVFCALWLAIFKKDETESEWVYRKWAQPIMLITAFGVVLGTIFFRELTSSLTHLEGIGRLFLYATHEEGGEYGTSTLLFMLLMTTGVFMARTGVKKNSSAQAMFFCIVIALSIPFFVLSGIDNTIARMMSYCTLFVIPYIGTLIKDYKSLTLMSLAGVAMLAASCFVRFFVCFVWQGFNAAVPYTSTILGIG